MIIKDICVYLSKNIFCLSTNKHKINVNLDIFSIVRKAGLLDFTEKG